MKLKNSISDLISKSHIPTDLLESFLDETLILKAKEVSIKEFDEKVEAWAVIGAWGSHGEWKIPTIVCHIPQDQVTTTQVRQIIDALYLYFKEKHPGSSWVYEKFESQIRDMRLRAVFLREVYEMISENLTTDEQVWFQSLIQLYSAFGIDPNLELTDLDRAKMVKFFVGNDVKYQQIKNDPDKLKTYYHSKVRKLLELRDKGTITSKSRSIWQQWFQKLKLDRLFWKKKKVPRFQELQNKYQHHINTLFRPLNDQLWSLLYHLWSAELLTEARIPKDKSLKLQNHVTEIIEKNKNDKLWAIKEIMKLVKNTFLWRENHWSPSRTLKDTVTSCVWYATLAQYIEQIPWVQYASCNIPWHTAWFVLEEGKLHFLDIWANIFLAISDEDFKDTGIDYQTICQYVIGKRKDTTRFTLPNTIVAQYRNKINKDTTSEEFQQFCDNISEEKWAWIYDKEKILASAVAFNLWKIYHSLWKDGKLKYDEKVEQYNKAIEYYTLAYQLWDIEAYLNLWEIYHSLWEDGKLKYDEKVEQYNKAIEYYTLAYQLWDTRAYFNLWNLYDDLKQYEKAIEYYKKFIFFYENTPWYKEFILYTSKRISSIRIATWNVQKVGVD